MPDTSSTMTCAGLPLKVLRNVLANTPKTRTLDASLTPAGVLLLLYPKDGHCRVLLNKRSELVEEHKGEIALPGGRRDSEDRHMLDTALRETHEEMGVDPAHVEVLGALDDVVTLSDYVISTFVGTIPAPYPFSPNEEVAEVIEAPVDWLLNPNSCRDDVWLDGSRPVRRPAFGYAGHLIYGATGQILCQFLDAMSTAGEKESAWGNEQT